MRLKKSACGSKEGEEGSIITEKMDEPSEEIEVGPTSIDVTDEQPSTVEAPSAEQQDELQEQNKQKEQSQEKSRISKNKQKRRITSYLSNTSKQVEKQGNQINKMMIMIQSLQKQKLARAKQEWGSHKYSQENRFNLKSASCKSK